MLIFFRFNNNIKIADDVPNWFHVRVISTSSCPVWSISGRLKTILPVTEESFLGALRPFYWLWSQKSFSDNAMTCSTPIYIFSEINKFIIHCDTHSSTWWAHFTNGEIETFPSTLDSNIHFTLHSILHNPNLKTAIIILFSLLRNISALTYL